MYCSLATAPISPAITLSAGTWFLPLIKNTWVNFSILFLLVFTTVISPFNLPVITLNKEILPTNGSAIVLNTIAENGLSSLNWINSSLFDSIFNAFCGIAYLGDGKHSTISSNNVFIPIIFVAEPHITGAISPDAHPFIKPSYISKSLSSPSLKYFSNNTSSVSATDSIIICLHSSTLLTNSGGISATSIILVFGL